MRRAAKIGTGEIRRDFLSVMTIVFEKREEGRRIARPNARRQQLAADIRHLLREADKEMARIMAEARATDYGRIGVSR